MSEVSKEIAFTVKDIQDVITINGQQYLLCPKDKLEKLLLDNIEFKKSDAEHKQEMELIKEAVFAILGVLGLTDPATGKLRAGLESGEESYIKHIGKSLTSITTMIVLGQNKKLEEKFSFFKKVMPLVKKYAGNH